MQGMANNSAIDSLNTLLQEQSQRDTARVNTLNALAWVIYASDPAACRNYAVEGLAISEEIDYLYGRAKSYSNLGIGLYMASEYDSALVIFDLAIAAWEQHGDQKELAMAYNNKANISYMRGRYEIAIENYLEAARRFEAQNYIPGITATRLNIAMINEFLGQKEAALAEYEKCLAIYREQNNKQGLNICLSSIGIIKRDRGEYDEAQAMFEESLEVALSIDDKAGIAGAYINMGNLFRQKGDDQLCLEYHQKALPIYEALENRVQIALCKINMGGSYMDLGQPHRAEPLIKEGLALAQEMQDLKRAALAHKGLSDLYASTGNYKAALEQHKAFKAVKDSVFQQESDKSIKEMEAKYDSDKKQLELEKSELERQRQEAEFKARDEASQSRIVLLTSGGGGVVVLAIFILIGYRNKAKSNKIISAQKLEVEQQRDIATEQRLMVEEKNKEILDSISYAKRLQHALLPSQQLVKSYFKDSFIVYLPKDIVAGDFYWMHQVTLGNGDVLKLFAVADCTGHGVPGAMVSVVCSNALNIAVKELGIHEPGKVLDKVRELVIESFDESGEGVRDGMDIAFCSLKVARTGAKPTLQYAGANNALWVMRNNDQPIVANELPRTTLFTSETSGAQLLEVKADKQPIGKHESTIAYTTHTFELQPNDAIYLFSDGFADQFGGPRGKKFKYKPFRQLFMEASAQTMGQQYDLICQTFDTWKGNFEQIDDVCVLGIRV